MSRRRSEEAIDAPPRPLPRRRRRAAASTPAVAQRVWEQIQGFSGFGFPKAHSAAFGLLAYQSAWLRVHRAPEFLCALLNEQPMGFYPPDSLVHEAQRRGVRVAAPRRQPQPRPLPRRAASGGGLVVRVGLGYVKGVREEEMESLVAARESGGPYRGIADLASRSGAGRDGLERLAWAGALDEIPRRRRRASAARALWQVGVAPTRPRPGGGHPAGAAAGARRAAARWSRWADWETMIADYRSTGMSLGEHPLALMRDGLDPELLRSTDLARVADGSEVEVAGMVVARQRPETAKGIVFMLLEDERGVVNLIVPPPVYERHRALVRAAPLLRARGRLERREGVVNILVAEVARAAAPSADGAPPRSRKPALGGGAVRASARSPSCARSPPPATASGAAGAEPRTPVQQRRGERSP